MLTVIILCLIHNVLDIIKIPKASFKVPNKNLVVHIAAAWRLV